jgi:anti-sigma regulatory factor (Ser/Thr protein kinase)
LVRVAIEDPSGVSEARRQAALLARHWGPDAGPAGALALGVTEAATNIVKHARHGEMVLRALDHGGEGVEVLALDKGPGIANIAESMRDGHSTAGSPGTGLGTLARMTSGLEIYSRPGQGTIVRFEVTAKREPRAQPAGLGVVSLPKPGEIQCGDGWLVTGPATRRVVVVVDGLGHGSEAAVAARAALAAAARQADRAPADIISAMDGALRPTRGAAACVAVLEQERGVCTFCGIGNIAASIHANGASRSMVSHNGILGHQVRKVQEFSYPFPGDALCVLHSDGMATRWNLEAYPGINRRHPALVAGVLYRDFRRGRDDVTVVALANRQP